MQQSIIISITLTTVFIHTGYCIPSSTGNSRNVPRAETNVPRRDRITPDLNHRDESQPSSPASHQGSPASRQGSPASHQGSQPSSQPSSPAPHQGSPASRQGSPASHQGSQPSSPAQPIPNLGELIAPGRRPDTPGNPYFRVPDLNLLPIEEAAPQPSSSAAPARAALTVHREDGRRPVLILDTGAPPMELRAPIRPHAPTSLVVEQLPGQVPRFVHEADVRTHVEPRVRVVQPHAPGTLVVDQQPGRASWLVLGEDAQPPLVPQPLVPQPPAMGSQGNYLPQLSHTGTMEFVEVINPSMVRPQDVVLTPAQMIGPDRQMINRFVPWGQASGSQPPPLAPTGQASGSQPPPLGNQQRPPVVPVFERNQLVFSESQPPQGRAQGRAQGRGSPQGRGSRKDKGKGIQRGG